MKSRALYTWILLFSALAVVRAELKDRLHINEIMVGNLDVFVDPSWNFGSWVELFNDSTGDIELRGLWLSDDLGQLRKARVPAVVVPAQGYKNLWLGHRDKYCPTQIAFQLNPEGGALYVSDGAGNLLLSQEYPPMPPRSSFARVGDGEWSLTSTPSPQRANDGMTLCTERLDAPHVSADSQLFSGSLAFSVDIPAGCTLRYTTDGSTPTLTNGQTGGGNFTVTGDAVYRFALFRDGWLSSPVVTRSFFVDRTFSLPILSLVTAPANLYSDTLGFFVRGVNGRAGRGQSTPCNWNMDWDRPCNFELLDATGRPLINQEAEISRCGGWSRAYTPYSFKIHATKFFEGRKTLDFPFFEAKPYLRHKTLQVRNGGNDYKYRITDAFLQQIVGTSGLDIDYQEYLPVVHFINGAFRGVINVREPNNKQHVYANYGLDDDEIDMFEIDADTGYVQMCGTSAAWKELYRLSRMAVLDRYYEEVQKLLDVDEFCNYMAVELYVGCTDWPQNNLKGFRPKSDGRFRFILYDTDSSFGTTTPFTLFAGKKTYSFNTLYGESVTRYTKEIEIVTIFLNLLKNASFRRHFIDAFCLVAGSVFEPTRCEEIITRLAARVEPMQVIADGYGRNNSPTAKANSMIASLKDRPATLIRALKSYPNMGLSNTAVQQIQFRSNIPEAQLEVNNQVVPTGRFCGALFPPFRLKASAPAGYRFLGWHKIDGEERGTEKTLVDKGAFWRYYDQGPQEGTDWAKLSFSDTKWSQGRAPLGYGSLTYGTTVSYGSDSKKKHPAYYYRSSFVLSAAPPAGSKVLLDYWLDDGMVVYVNGVEAARYNMPDGAVSGTTFSTTYAGTEPFEGQIVLDASLFQRGKNVVAVEVHNNSYTSSDSYWDARLVLQEPLTFDAASDYMQREPELQVDEAGDTLRVLACFERIPPSETARPLPPIVVNEVSASNSIYVNEYYKRNDWVELYNTTDTDIDLRGLYLSDDVQNPYKYRIGDDGATVGTVIPAGGFRIVWCDKVAATSMLHAPFKLANEDGAAVILTGAGWADTLTYQMHDGTQTVGRFPDGGTEIYRMTIPTIERRNTIGMLSTRLGAPDGDDADRMTDICHASSLSLTYVGDALAVRSDEADRVSLTICDVSGRVVMQQTLQLAAGRTRVSLALLRSGVYVARVEDTLGNVCTTKLKR